MLNQLQPLLRQLRLSGLGETLPVRLQEAAANRLTHEEFFMLVLQDEINIRHQRRIQRRTKLADFQRLKTLENENSRLKRVVADLTLDKQMLQDVLSRKW